jgi:FMN phosphatase YigB (HAD superfamily)
MIQAILFDLDDTLLTTTLRTFLPGYFRALTARLGHLVDPKALVDLIMASTTEMAMPHDPGLTNQEVFEAHFFPRIAIPEATLRGLFDEFYAHDFPSLRALTSPRPEARAVVAAAFAHCRDVVIATQPVFPQTAIRQRMEWAGVADFPFRLVTSYENMHSCKPQPAYYLEIAAILHRQPGECLMVGNDREQDIEPARQAGMATYWVNDETPFGTDYDPRGSLARLTEFLSVCLPVSARDSASVGQAFSP